MDNKYFSTITGKGWEIPNKKTPNSSTSLSSDETSAQVIQPSSIRSSSSSLQYLSSSLSSVYGSYGSWFSKRIGMQSPSAKTNESSEQSYFQHHNGSSTSLHQVALNHNRVTPLPSPSINEYEEFPWCSSPSSPRTDNTQQAWPAHTEPSFQNVDIKRTCNRITNAKDLDQAFESICQFDSDSFKAETSAPSEGHAQVLEVELEIDSHSSYSELLPKYTSFLPNFVPWFQLQAVPVTSDAERKVLNAMKADLHTREYSRTLLISLRSREIKDIVVEKDHFRAAAGATRAAASEKTVYSQPKPVKMGSTYDDPEISEYNDGIAFDQVKAGSSAATVESVQPQLAKLGFGMTMNDANTLAAKAKEAKRAASGPKYTGQVAAQFGGQKAISSDMLFGRGSYDEEASKEAKDKLKTNFNNATSISSSSYFGEEDEQDEFGRPAARSQTGGAGFVEFNNDADDDFQVLRDAVEQGAQKLGNYLRDYLRN